MEYMSIIRFAMLGLSIVFIVVMGSFFIMNRIKRNKLVSEKTRKTRPNDLSALVSGAQPDSVQEAVIPSVKRITVAPATEYKPAVHTSTPHLVNTSPRFQVVNQSAYAGGTGNYYKSVQ